jgi:CBS domain-containing protein
MDLFAVVHHLLDAGVRRLPVLEMDRLVGIVSRRDVLRVIRRHYGSGRRQR